MTRFAQLELDLRLPPETASAGIARRSIRAALEGSVVDETIADVELLVSELVTNSVLHGPSTRPIEIHMRKDDSGLEGEVVDAGRGFDPGAVRKPPRTAEKGWGLFLVQRVADRWGVRRRLRRTAVWFRVQAAAPAS